MANIRNEGEEMELFKTEDYYVLLNSESSLWCSRRTGELEAKPSWELANCGDLECLGVFYGFVGKIELQSSPESSRLVLIKEISSVGRLPDKRTVVKIKSVTFVDPFHSSNSDSQTPSLDLKTCKKHKQGSFSINFEAPQKAALAKTWGQIKSATNSIKNTTQHAAALATYQVKGVTTRKDAKEKEKFEKRILEELQRVFSETESFYFCLGDPGSVTCDLTNSLQRTHSDDPSTDDRFFWNKQMLKDVISINTNLSKAWILPIIQGYVQIEKCSLEYDPSITGASRIERFTLTLISRRSRFRAGTRYKRRGLDESGNCANYVETEQIVSVGEHQMSLVEVRGSVPLFWSQPGFKYRPPPLIDKGEAETRVAFEKHISEELEKYGPVCIVNLVEQTGKEKIIWEGFTQQVLHFNSDQVTYTSFDFHEHCRGLRFENVGLLLARLDEVIQEMGFFWKDSRGVICRQAGVFRVNCIDCLDRTNVVQTGLAKSVLEVQLTKLGLVAPEQPLPSALRQTFQLLWANNGDVISKQYAGTNALKGDYTRTGERKFTGLVKDGMNSANRYYLSRFKDAYRQATIDIMQGEVVSELGDESDELNAQHVSEVTAQHVKLLIEDCKKALIPPSCLVLAAWGLINADPVTGDPTETDMDTILILTKDSYFIADYDDEVDQVTKLEQIPLDSITMVELGPLPIHLHSPLQIFNKNKNKQNSHYCLRFRYKVCGKTSTHTLRSSNLRFFNNVAVVIKNEEEMIESLRAVCECVKVAMETIGCNDVVWSLDVPMEARPPLSPLLSPITRNVSEAQLGQLKNVGSKALSNMSSTFSKIGNSLTPGRKNVSPSNLDHPKPRYAVFRAYHHSTPISSPSPISCIRLWVSKIRQLFIFIIQCKTIEVSIGGSESTDEDDDVICEGEWTGTGGDRFIPSVGIVMAQRTLDSPPDTPHSRNVPTCLQVSSSTHPTKKRTLSRSSGEVASEEGDRLDVKPETLGKSSSERDLTLKGLPGSQSENALRNALRSAAKDFVTSPSAVFSPFGKLVQSLGQNLDPRKLKQPRPSLGGTSSAENQRLAKMWSDFQCKSRLIAV